MRAWEAVLAWILACVSSACVDVAHAGIIIIVNIIIVGIVPILSRPRRDGGAVWLVSLRVQQQQHAAAAYQASAAPFVRAALCKMNGVRYIRPSSPSKPWASAATRPG